MYLRHQYLPPEVCMTRLPAVKHPSLDSKTSALALSVGTQRSLVETRCGLGWTHSAAQLAVNTQFS